MTGLSRIDTIDMCKLINLLFCSADTILPDRGKQLLRWHG
jgi:hypothetical protein